MQQIKLESTCPKPKNMQAAKRSVEKWFFTLLWQFPFPWHIVLECSRGIRATFDKILRNRSRPFKRCWPPFFARSPARRRLLTMWVHKAISSCSTICRNLIHLIRALMMVSWVHTDAPTSNLIMCYHPTVPNNLKHLTFCDLSRQ